jgi:16S rRNA processing protein RimM
LPEDGPLLIVGRCGSAHGIKGWVTVRTYTEPADNLLRYAPWHVRTATGWVELEVVEYRTHRRGYAVHFKGFDDRTAAESLRGCPIGVAADQLPPTDEDEYYWKDLIGLVVYDAGGRLLGEVTGVMDTAGHDLLIVRRADDRAAGDLLIPFVRDIVTTVDLGAGHLIADWDPDF